MQIEYCSRLAEHCSEPITYSVNNMIPIMLCIVLISLYASLYTKKGEIGGIFGAAFKWVVRI